MRSLRSTSSALALALSAFGLVACSPGGGACTPETDRDFCARLDRDCAEVTAFDSCGTSRMVNCGMCDAPETCGGGGRANVCAMPGDGGVADGGFTISDAGMPDAPSDAGCPLCPTGTHWIDSHFTLTDNQPVVNGIPYTHAFDAFVGEEIELRISFDSVVETPSMGPFMGMRSLRVDVAEGRAASTSLSVLVANLNGRSANMILEPFGSTASARFSMAGPEAGERFSVEIACNMTGLTNNASGIPVSDSFTCASGSVILRRFRASDGAMTDYANGTGSLEHHQP